MTVNGITRRAAPSATRVIDAASTRRRGGAAIRQAGCIAVGLAAVFWHSSAAAQTAGETPSLLTMVSTLTDTGVYQFNALAFAAARANDAAYAKLLPLCAGAGTAACAGATQQLYYQLRALEDNANEFLGRGETTYSLRLQPSGVANALQWTAPEEYSAQGSMTSQFANSQASILTNRFAALHFASMATRLAANVDDGSSATWAAAYSALGGSAGADVSNVSFGRFSAFVNSGFGAGVKSPTTFEDAFAFDSTEASAGLDYRISDRLVVGLLAGHTERRVDFNSAESVVAGGIRGNGQSGTLYVQYEGDAAYLNGSLGSQHMSLRSQRKITYPSNNPLVPSVNVTAVSDASAVTTTASAAGGYVWHYKAASVEPYINGVYTHTRIGSFTENASNGFDVRLDGQSIVSTEAMLGLKLQYAILPPFGVIVPYVYGEYRHQFAESSRTVGSSYASDASASSDFNLPTDAAPNHYYVAGAGASIVLPHGIQGFVQYIRVLQYSNYSDHVFSGGLRWEF
ncbi:MAG TPA: autotransporter outer membrane beta-barrel domain-containing protein [Steroidobacteraceae bacterium]|nr:autotransporter outer membrane beta-barrel domain-containing protein [Steroidobacteraceae bacterium]